VSTRSLLRSVMRLCARLFERWTTFVTGRSSLPSSAAEWRALTPSRARARRLDDALFARSVPRFPRGKPAFGARPAVERAPCARAC
jgi:hypothetical protein